MTKTVTLEDLLRDCDAAYARMSAKNPHRELISQCAQVLIAQAQMIHDLRVAPPAAPGLVLTDG